MHLKKMLKATGFQRSAQKVFIINYNIVIKRRVKKTKELSLKNQFGIIVTTLK